MSVVLLFFELGRGDFGSTGDRLLDPVTVCLFCYSPLVVVEH